MCYLHSDTAVLSLLFPSLSYQGVRIVYHSNHRVLLVINISTTWKSFYIFIITTSWLFKKSYGIEQIDPMITVYVDLRENFVWWQCTCHARQHFTLPWKQNMFVVPLHAFHFTALSCRYPRRAWSGFFHDRVAMP